MLTSLAIIVATSVVIMYACNSFDNASSYLGRNMPPGVKGATINAIASSMPELLTVTFLLFLYHDHDGFSAGIATCAGSAVFNAVIIPGLSILAVLFVGVKQSRGSRYKPVYITVSKGTIIRDGLFFLLAEIILIYFLRGTQMVWWMGGTLVITYIAYFSYMMYQFKMHQPTGEDDDDEEDEEVSLFTAIRTLNFEQIFFRGDNSAVPPTPQAWSILTMSVTVIAAACYFLAEATMDLAVALSVPPFVAAVIFTAAATSVPDTVISVKDALNGNYDDAVSNAIGSNIFDITICLGLPLFVYGLVYGDVTLSSTSGAADVQTLRIGLIATTVLVLSILLVGRKLGRVKAIMLFSIYVIWLLAIIYGLT